LNKRCVNRTEFGALIDESVGFKAILEHQLDFKVGMEKAILQEGFKVFEFNPSLHNPNDHDTTGLSAYSTLLPGSDYI
jgi:hypothetical protein